MAPGATASPPTTPGDLLETPAVHSQSDFLLQPHGTPHKRKETSPSQPQLIISGAASWDLEELDVLASETEGKMVDVSYTRAVSFRPQGKAMFPWVQRVFLCPHDKAMCLSDLTLYLPFVMLPASPPPPNPASLGEQGKEHKATSHVSPSPQPHSNKDLNTFPKLTRALLSMPPLEGWGGQKRPQGRLGPAFSGPFVGWAELGSHRG